MELNKFYNMDCMDYMKTVPDKFFELAIVDPPYGIDLKGPCGHSLKWGGIQKVNNNPAGMNYFDELFRISKNYII